MTSIHKIGSLTAVAAISALLFTGCSSTNAETPPAAEATQETTQTAPATEEVVEEEAEAEVAQPESSPEGYQAIYDEYSARLTNECPSLSMMECAELSTEGMTKMASYMYKAKGTDGQMATYEEWAGKLTDVYMASVQ